MGGLPVEWFNNHRLLESIGNIPLAEAEAKYDLQCTESAKLARLNSTSLR